MWKNNKFVSLAMNEMRKTGSLPFSSMSRQVGSFDLGQTQIWAELNLVPLHVKHLMEELWGLAVGSDYPLDWIVPWNGLID